MHNIDYQSRYGKISYCDNKSNKVTILFIHGLSLSKDVFYRQIETLKNDFRIITIDFLGHGKSDDAIDPHIAYSIPGFADSLIELLNFLDIKKLFIYGWSLGGAVALQLLENFSGVQKIILDGYPPVSYKENNFENVYIFNESTHLLFKKNYTVEEAQFYLDFGGIQESCDHSKIHIQKILNSVLRSSGIMREYVMNSIMNFEGVSPKECVEKNKDKIKLLIGENDPGFHKSYIREYFNDVSIFFNDTGHSCFWEHPKHVEDIIYSFFSKSK
ncbi:alpha/beta hydrolase [Silvanigrella aquatica]|uniref:AB hydrolase-1 domain-containing protein n=1 Tax=Silvanigrella aquatica TaxID=1915309 RepID=A0A1L4D261_9BACT|nr:alpha/beta fold hydrolase [Silvanigrella aquatica]APJ04295.1 hypothetical protein AXG55_10410 [Silvanigrella aquatica]